MNTNTHNAALTPNDTPAAANPSRVRMAFNTSRRDPITFVDDEDRIDHR